MRADEPAPLMWGAMPVSLAVKLSRSIKDTQRRRSADGLGPDRELQGFLEALTRAYGGLEGTPLGECGCGSDGEDMTTAPRLLTYDEVAARLGVSTKTVKRLTTSKELQPVHIGTAARVHTEDLETYMNSLRQGNVA